MKVKAVGGGVWAGYENVVQMDKDEREALQNPVHHSLERHASILETKGHPRKFPEAKRSDHCSFSDVG